MGNIIHLTMKYFRIMLFVVFTLLFLGCSPKISKFFDHNRYLNNYYTEILNDSLQLFLKSPADISFETDRNQLKKVIGNQDFRLKEEVLLYGKTDDPPYEFFVTTPTKDPQNYPENLIVFDTVIQDKMFRFVGNSLTDTQNKSLKIDLENIFKSLRVGSDYHMHISSIHEITEKYYSSNKFYAALNELIDFPVYNPQDEWEKLQLKLTFASFLGNNDYYRDFLANYESQNKIRDSVTSIINQNAEFDKNALNKILLEAKDHQIVMFNENHFYPAHRIPVYELLPELKNIGYQYLALEALSPGQDSLLNLPNAHPLLENGFYTQEQNFSNLIRRAKKIGFEFVAYENNDPTKDREKSQAENLYNRTFRNNPDAKVVVLAGIDHILEKPTSSGKEWMATVFKKTYAIDPLTISQTHMNSYRKLISEGNYALINSEKFSNERFRIVDYFLLNNDHKILFENDVTFNFKNPSQKEIQLSLFYANEISNEKDYHLKIPFYSTILKPGESLDLPFPAKRQFHLLTFDKKGKIIDKQIFNP